MRVSISAIGSDKLIAIVPSFPHVTTHEENGFFPVRYQLAFRIPGIKPLLAMFRRQIRQILNLRYTLRGRPQIWQRRTTRVVNFGLRLALAINAFVAIKSGFLTG
jgi:hypothetical protein